MASFMVILMVVTLTTMSFVVSPSYSLSSHQLKIDTIPAAPALLPNTVPVSPSTKLSPDISPLLPSSGGLMPSTDSASIPTIPSNPSQNPDEVAAFSPDSALSPSGHSRDSSKHCLDHHLEAPKGCSGHLVQVYGPFFQLI